MPGLNLLAIARKQTVQLIEEHMSGSPPGGGGVSMEQVKQEIGTSVKTAVDTAVTGLNETIDSNKNETENKIKEIETSLSGKADSTVATTTENGLFSAEDKTKLDGIAEGAEANIISGVVLNGEQLSPDDSGSVFINIESSIDEISVNGINVPLKDKKADITVPVSLSDLVNDLNISAPPVSSVSVNNMSISPDENKNININIPTKISGFENDLLLEKNSIEKILVNGTEIKPDENRVVDIPHPTRLSDLVDDINASAGGIGQISVNGIPVETDSNGNVSLTVPSKTSELGNDSGFEANRIDGISVNGTELSPDGNKKVNITVPVKTSQITNDSGFVTSEAVDEKINGHVSGIYRFKGMVENYASLPDTNVLTGDAYIIKTADAENSINAGDNAIAIADENGTVTWNILSGTVDLSRYVMKETGKVLSSNDFTPEYKDKLDTLQNYVHPSYTSCDTGLYKFSVDSSGHVGQFTPVLKSDILLLGIQEELSPLSDNDIAAMFADL